MLAKKKSIYPLFAPIAVVSALALFGAGCSPAGPRAALKGERYIERGDYADAVAELKVATTLLTTNAAVWNYYGVALQGAGQPDEAANAYKRALELDRDLMEAHYNLGNLWLDQNKPDQARVEFTAYTLRRNNDADGWFKLGSAQLRVGDVVQAEKSFSAVLSLRPNDAEAYNGLGLARVQRGLARDAAKFFAAAIQCKPGYGPAILNLATVDQQYLHDDKAALENYHAYLNLQPRPDNWDDVNALANNLERGESRVTAAPPVEHTNPPVAESRTVQHPAPAQTASRPNYTVQEPAPAVKPSQHHSSTTPRTPPPQAAAGETYAVQSAPPQPVRVEAEQPIVTTPPPANTGTPAATAANPSADNQPPLEEIPVEPPPPPKKSGFWHNLFGGSSKPTAAQDKYMGTGLTPMTPAESDTAVAPAATSPGSPAVNAGAKKPAEPAPVFARYNYFSPAKPRPGNHSAGSPAAGAFAKARVFETEEKWTDALQWYQKAADYDPSWFQAQYNAGVLGHRLRNFAVALPRYEWALAIQPDSVDARYNFALALRTCGFPVDAAAELKKILVANPDEVRAHLALANIYAQSLRDIPQAREHYLKVLELDPNSPQAPDIRFWLSANQK